MPVKTENEKSLILAEINELGRKFSDVTVQFHHCIAESVGLGGTDHKYLGILFEHGEMTAGQLAEISGLTTGAITGVLDRLEKQGLLSREKDPADRRKVVVKPNQEIAMQKLGPIFQSLVQKHSELNSKYTLAELGVIKNYLEETVKMTAELVGELKQGKG